MYLASVRLRLMAWFGVHDSPPSTEQLQQEQQQQQEEEEVEEAEEEVEAQNGLYGQVRKKPLLPTTHTIHHTPYIRCTYRLRI